MTTTALRRRPVVASSVGVVAVLAWLVLVLWGRSPYARFLGHGRLGPDIWAVPVAVGGWVVMILAMMLPTSLPLVEMFRRMTDRRADRRGLLALLVAGYVAVWAAFGALVHAGDLVIHQLAVGAVRPELIAAAVLVTAGLYQFSSLKERCLAKCRSPRMFIAGHWHGRDARREALTLGAHHGLYCLGCCWTLMLVMFAVGTGNLGWMLGLGAIMAIEKNAAWGRRLSAPVGLGLLAAAVVAAVA